MGLGRQRPSFVVRAGERERAELVASSPHEHFLYSPDRGKAIVDLYTKRKTSSRSSVTTKNGLGASHRVDPSPSETTAIVQSDVREGSNTPWGRLNSQAWSARTPKCAFKSASPVEKLAHGAQLQQKRAWRLAPSGPKSTRNDCGGAIRCTGQLQRTLREAKNASMERTHTPVCFQVGLSS